MRLYTAVIVEPREHPALSFVLNNFLKNLSDDWLIIIMHGSKNGKYIDNIISTDLQKYRSRIAKINLFVDNLNINQYTELFLSEAFYKNIPTETFLVFQTDTMICEKNKDLINQFLDYDYVGAPWWQWGDVGNGGLSLRKKSVALNCIRNYKWNGESEDIFFSFKIFNKPDNKKARMFSIETCFTEKTFGLHKAWAYLSKPEIKLMMQEFEGMNQLMQMNGIDINNFI